MINVFHSSLSFDPPLRAIQYDEALTSAKQGDTVYFVYCGGLMTQCFSNPTGNRVRCDICKRTFRNDKKRFKDLKFVTLSELISKETIDKIKTMSFSYSKLEDIMEYKYKNCTVGEAAFSSYVSCSRNLYPLLDTNFRTFFDDILRNGIYTTEAMIEAVKRFKPDKITLFNGRMAENRPVREVAIDNNIDFVSLELIYGQEQNYKMIAENESIHSIDMYTRKIKEQWETAPESEQEKVEIGSSFYINRRNAKPAGDKVYTANQKQGLLPENWDKTKYNVLIFNSSEDEFVALNDEYGKYQLFQSQLEGIKYIKQCLLSEEDVKVTLRVHPNLANIEYKYAKDLTRIQSHNFMVVEGKSQISSYSLLDAADLVIVFGSTMGAEAAYWGKPTILLSGAIYQFLDVCYRPSTKEELITLILQRPRPLDNKGAILYGYFIMNKNHPYYSYVNYDWEYKDVNLLGKKVTLMLNNWRKWMGSRRLYELKRRVEYRFGYLKYKIKSVEVERYSIPTNEL